MPNSRMTRAKLVATRSLGGGSLAQKSRQTRLPRQVAILRHLPVYVPTCALARVPALPVCMTAHALAAARRRHLASASGGSGLAAGLGLRQAHAIRAGRDGPAASSAITSRAPCPAACMHVSDAPMRCFQCAGGQCPICQDLPREPLKLQCGHIFCETCITEWLDRERTCPMCRSTVRHDGLQSYGNGTTSMLPSVF
jgi:Ring finger domain